MEGIKILIQLCPDQLISGSNTLKIIKLKILKYMGYFRNFNKKVSQILVIHL